jgi:hypothetical protein
MVPPGGTEMTTLIVFAICDQAACSDVPIPRLSNANVPIRKARSGGITIPLKTTLNIATTSHENALVSPMAQCAAGDRIVRVSTGSRQSLMIVT